MRTLHSIPIEKQYPPIDDDVKVGISRFLTYWADRFGPRIRITEDGRVFYKNRNENFWYEFANIADWNPADYWSENERQGHTWFDDTFSWISDKIEIVPSTFQRGRDI